MSEVPNDRGKATMYVITEKGLEVGPFAYGEVAGSRLLCTNSYYSQRKDGRQGIYSSNLKDLEDKRRLKIVDLGNSFLPSENTSVENRGKRAVKGTENGDFAIGNCRGYRSVRISFKPRENKDNLDDKHEERIRRSLEIFNVVFDTPLSGRKEYKQSLVDSSQNELNKTLMKRKNEMILEELVKLREMYNKNSDFCSKPKLEKRQREKTIRLNDTRFPAKIKTLHVENKASPCLKLPSLRRVNITPNRYSKKENSDAKEEVSANKEEASSSRIKKSLNNNLIFLNPSSVYSQIKAESTAKLNIKKCKFTDDKPKVGLQSVLDQRTGEMHSVPGVVTYRPWDYNQWSRKRNIVRRTRLHPRSPLVTCVSVFPSIPEK